MPELPDVIVYQERLEDRLRGEVLQRIRMPSVSLVRTYEPAIEAAEGRRVEAIERLGKRIVFVFEGELFFVLHLMITGRLKWRSAGAKIPRKYAHGALDFTHGTLLLTEMGAKKRASLHVLEGRSSLQAHDPGGADVLTMSRDDFAATLRTRNNTLKRALTDPRRFDGIGNAYSDEILHAACLSPLRWTDRITDDEIERLHTATRETLVTWIERLRDDVGDGWPDKVTAFREGMAAHGRYREPCPRCGDPIQRIVHASNETNYCATCQTDGQVFADRALSKLLGKDWPRTIEAWESFREGDAT